MRFKVKTITPDGVYLGPELIIELKDLVQMLGRLSPDERVKLEIKRTRS